MKMFVIKKYAIAEKKSFFLLKQKKNDIGYI